MPNSFFFLPPKTSQRKSRQEIELSHSAAKSHIARGIHHRRRGGTQPKAVSNGSRETSKSETRSKKRTASRIPVNSGSSIILATSPTWYCPNAWPVSAPELASPRTVVLLHHCTTVFWPEYDAQGRSKLHPPPFMICWSALIEPGPVVFHASMWKAALSLSNKTKLPLSDTESFQHHRAALRCIRQALNQPPCLIRDEILFSIAILASPDEPDAAQEAESIGPAFRYPFPDLLWLLKGKQPNTSHAQALYHLVDLKGGIDCITLPGLAPSINHLDVIRSTHNLSRPRFPLNQNFRHLSKNCNRHNCFGIVQDPQTLAPFDAADGVFQHSISNDLHEVLQDVRAWLKVLEIYCEGSLPSHTLALISIHRIIIQHKLLSTIAEGEDITSSLSLTAGNMGDVKRTSETPNMDRLLQLALLIFALGVTFPVLSDRPFAVLASTLKVQVEHDLPALRQEWLRLFGIWVCVLGGMAALQIQDAGLRIWFVDAIYHIGTMEDESTSDSSQGSGFCMVFCSWAEMKAHISRTFVWYDDACEDGAQVLWDEVQSYYIVLGLDGGFS